MAAGEEFQGLGVAAIFHGEMGTADVLASLAIARLKAAGIPAVQSPSSTSTTWGTFGTMPSLPHRVLVPLERLEEAMSILESEDEEA